MLTRASSVVRCTPSVVTAIAVRPVTVSCMATDAKAAPIHRPRAVAKKFRGVSKWTLAERAALQKRELDRLRTTEVPWPDAKRHETIASHNNKALQVMNHAALAKWRAEWDEYKTAHLQAIRKDQALRRQYAREQFERQRLGRVRHIANMAGVRKESDAKWAVREKHLCDKRDAKLVGEKAARQYQLQYLINERNRHWPAAVPISPEIFEKEVELEGFWPESVATATPFGRKAEQAALAEEAQQAAFH